MKITAIEDQKSRHEEQASFLVIAADFMASTFWLPPKTKHLVDVPLVSPNQQGGFA
jgi:hypothetical protein